MSEPSLGDNRLKELAEAVIASRELNSPHLVESRTVTLSGLFAAENEFELAATPEAILALYAEIEKNRVCPDCKNIFSQPFKCTTCGAEKLYDATVRGQATTIEQLRARLERSDAKAEAAEKALRDIAIRAQRIREDKAVVGIEASFIERVAKEALKP